MGQSADRVGRSRQSHVRFHHIRARRWRATVRSGKVEQRELAANEPRRDQRFVTRHLLHQKAVGDHQGANGVAQIASQAATAMSTAASSSSTLRQGLYKVFCFAEPEHAAAFMARFGGERFDPTQRGRGARWAAMEAR